MRRARRRTAGTKPWLRWSAVLLCLLGWLLSVYLLQLTGGAQAQGRWLQALCGPAEGEERTFDCESVLHSRYAYLGGQAGAEGRRGLPWGAVGAAYFAFVGLWYLFVGPPTRSRAWWHLPIMLLVLVGAAGSVELVHVMAFELRRWCPACLIVHALNALLVVLTLAAFPWRRPRALQRPHPTTGLALATLLAGFLLTQVHFLFVHARTAIAGYRLLERNYLKIVEDPDFVRWDYERQPTVSLPLRDDDVILGPPTAAHTVVAFVDFQCPACRLVCERLAELRAAHPDRLRVVFRHFPLDAACNPTQQRSPHPEACAAARAVEAARLVGGPQAFEAMRQLLYERQDVLAGARYQQWAAELGLDPGAFAAALDAPEARQRIAADIALGEQLGLKAVPVLFLDGRRLDHWRNRAAWPALLGLEDEAATPKAGGP